MSKTFVITGASAGLGKAMALQAATYGAKVALLARRAEKLAAVADEIREAGGEALAVPTDISDANQVVQAFRTVHQKWHKIDVLVNNAGVINPIAPIHDFDENELDKLLKINVFGSFLAMREALIIMRHQQDGTIVNITSGAAYKPYEGWGAYGSSKAAMNMMTRIAAAENAEKNIHVFAIAPGVFASNMQDTIRQTPAEKFPPLQKFIELHEKGYLSDPADVGSLIAQVGLNAWPELNGKVLDIRDADFQNEIKLNGLIIPGALAV